jgi:hypothetical protein
MKLIRRSQKLNVSRLSSKLHHILGEENLMAIIQTKSTRPSNHDIPIRDNNQMQNS